jgi:hypothetical protein
MVRMQPLLLFFMLSQWLQDCKRGAADVGLQTVKGSGTITARGLMNDYLKNLTAKSNTPVVYVYDAVGDTQGALASQSVSEAKPSGGHIALYDLSPHLPWTLCCG